MRIIHVTDTSIYNYDGISTYINELLECSEKRGDQQLVLTTIPHNNKAKRKVLHNVPVFTFPHIPFLSSRKFKFAIPKNMGKVIDEFKPDLIWIHTIGPLGVYAAKKAKKQYPVIYTKHCFDGDLWCNHLKIPKSLQRIIKSAAYFIENSVIKPADKIIYHFNENAQIKLHKFSEKFRQLPPPLNKKFVRESEDKKINKNYFALGFCGRCDPEKGIVDIFKSIDLFTKRNPSKRVRLLLIGDGKVVNELKSVYPDVEVTVTGFVDDVIPYLDQLDAFVLASSTETTSLSSLEAYARGLTIFTRPVGYLGENAQLYDKVFTFNTHQELCDLIENKFKAEKHSSPTRHVGISKSIITFSDLYAAVTSEYA
jgi:glycosyltransferase involved in cell wall biosynthesis